MYQNLPLQPWVYIMKNKQGETLYIGKAKNIKKRVSSYFLKNSFWKKSMIEQIKKIDYFVVNNETEAILLETNLIKQNKPKYNIQMKDDKNYNFIKIDNQTDFPAWQIVRKIDTTKDIYLGPFFSKKEVMETLTYLQKIFPIRNCSKMLPKGCLNYHLKRCAWPCLGKISTQKYQQILADFIKVLKGKWNHLLKKIRDLEDISAHQLDFEKANQYKKNFENLQKIITTHSLVVQPEKKDLDVIIFKTYDYLKYYFLILKVRKWKVIFKETVHLKSSFIKNSSKILAEFLQKYYLEEKNEIPTEIILPEEIKNIKEMENALKKEKKKISLS